MQVQLTVRHVQMGCVAATTSLAGEVAARLCRRGVG